MGCEDETEKCKDCMGGGLKVSNIPADATMCYKILGFPSNGKSKCKECAGTGNLSQDPTKHTPCDEPEYAVGDKVSGTQPKTGYTFEGTVVKALEDGRYAVKIGETAYVIPKKHFKLAKGNEDFCKHCKGHGD